MKDDYNDIYFVLIIGIASFLIILGTGIYSTLRYGSFQNYGTSINYKYYCIHIWNAQHARVAKKHLTKTPRGGGRG